MFTLQGADYAYRALVEAMSEGAATLGADGTVLYCNQHLSSLLGLPIERIIGQPAARVLGDEQAQFDGCFAQALGGEAAKLVTDLRQTGERRITIQVSLRRMMVDEPTVRWW